MKNFPHQFNDLTKLTAALDIASVVIGSGANYADDGVFGEALAQGQVYTFRNKDISIAENIQHEKQKPTSSQGFRTAARDIRRFLNLSGLVNQTPAVSYTGNEILQAANNPPLRNALWRNAMLDLALTDATGRTSHPYRILLKLVADKPGIETTKLLLALEANDDSSQEYARILALADLTFPQIVTHLGVGEANARNATKVLPGIAEQVGDIARSGGFSSLAALPQTTEDALVGSVEQAFAAAQPQELNPVSVASIAALPNFAETTYKTVDLSAAIAMLKQRTIEHNKTVTSIAGVAAAQGFTLYQNPFDCLAHKPSSGSLLIEVKSLNGSSSDERSQTEKALGQLRGYKFFNVPKKFLAPRLVEVVAYSRPPSADAVGFLNANSIHPAWRNGDNWVATNFAGEISEFSPDKLLIN